MKKKKIKHKLELLTLFGIILFATLYLIFDSPIIGVILAFMFLLIGVISDDRVNGTGMHPSHSSSNIENDDDFEEYQFWKRINKKR